MLVLTRRIGEAVVIDDDIDVVILEINGNQVKPGIDAPAQVEILREELLET